jgi:hypothetical protein
MSTKKKKGGEKGELDITEKHIKYLNSSKISKSLEYAEFKKKIFDFEIKNVKTFYNEHTKIRDTVRGGYGVVNFVYNKSEDKLKIVKAVIDCPRREKELFWLWKFMNCPGFVQLLGFFKDTSPLMENPEGRPFGPPKDWYTNEKNRDKMIDAGTESVWNYPNQLYIVMEYYPYSLHHVIDPDRDADVFTNENLNRSILFTTASKEEGKKNTSKKSLTPPDDEDEESGDEEKNKSDEEGESEEEEEEEDESSGSDEGNSESEEEEEEVHLSKADELDKIYITNEWKIPPRSFAFIMNDKEIVQCMFELYYSVFYARCICLEGKTNRFFEHLDLNVRNITITIDKSPREYECNGKKIVITSIFRPIIIDFGISQGPWTIKRERITHEYLLTQKKEMKVDYISLLNVLNIIIERYGSNKLGPKSLSVKLGKFLKKFDERHPKVHHGSDIELIEKLLSMKRFIKDDSYYEEKRLKRLKKKEQKEKEVIIATTIINTDINNGSNNTSNTSMEKKSLNESSFISPFLKKKEEKNNNNVSIDSFKIHWN